MDVQITQKIYAFLRRTTKVVRQAFFVRNQMARGQIQSRCHQKCVRVKVRAQQVKRQMQTTTKEYLTRKRRVQPSPLLDVGVHSYLVAVNQLKEKLSVSNRKKYGFGYGSGELISFPFSSGCTKLRTKPVYEPIRKLEPFCESVLELKFQQGEKNIRTFFKVIFKQVGQMLRKW